VIVLRPPLTTVTLHAFGQPGSAVRPPARGPALTTCFARGCWAASSVRRAKAYVERAGAAQAVAALVGDGGHRPWLSSADQGTTCTSAIMVASRRVGLTIGAQQRAGRPRPGRRRSKPGGLDIRRLIHPRWNPLAEQIEQHGVLAGGGLLQQGRQGRGLGAGERRRGQDTFGPRASAASAVAGQEGRRGQRVTACISIQC